MIEINDKNIKLWSLIGQRATFGTIMLQLANLNENLMVLSSDVSTSQDWINLEKISLQIM